jgi:hypothetical protein
MFILKLRESPPSRLLVWCLPFAAAAFVALVRVMGSIGERIGRNTAIAFELTWTPERASRILAGWDARPDGPGLARELILLDFAFIAAYVVLLGALCLLTARAVTGEAQRLGLRLAVLAPAAGLLDAVEYLSMLGMSAGDHSSPSRLLVLTSSCAATAKFLLVIGCVVYVAVKGAPALVAHLRR